MDLTQSMLELGFRNRNENPENGVYEFLCEGIQMYYMPDEEGDEDYLRIVVPISYDNDEVDIAKANKVISDMNRTVRYTKAYHINDSMILICYEHCLTGCEVSPEILRHMINVLIFSYYEITNNLEIS